MKKLFLIILMLCACSPANENSINGYIEGKYIHISPSVGGVLEEIYVSKGQQVNKGDKLFAVDYEIWQRALKTAQNEVVAAQKQLSQEEAILANAEKEFTRAEKLIKSNFASQASYDAKLADFESTKAKVAKLKILVDSAEQNLLAVQKQYEQNIATAKVSGLVNDVYFRLGEFVSGGNPIVSILPPKNVKVKFFVSEKDFARLKYNQQIFITCDGVSREIPAKISYISDSAEYTPPVIYSTESRSKLVFMVEAIFENLDDILPPGLPVSVRIN